MGYFKLQMEDMNKLVSVIIPTYGRALYIDTAIRSVMKQTYKDIEIIVVDDNGLGTEIQKETKKIIEKYVNIVYIPLVTNCGGAMARNIGIRKARGKWITFLDDDDIFLPNYVEKMVAEIERCNFSIVYEAQWYCLQNEIAFCSKKQPIKIEGRIWEKVLCASIPISIFLLFDREQILKTQLFDETFRAYDDYDFWLNLSREFSFGCVTEPLTVVRRENNGHLSTNVKKVREGLERLSTKWMPLLSDEESDLFEKFLNKHKEKIERLQLMESANSSLWKRVKMVHYLSKKYRISVKKTILDYFECFVKEGALKLKLSIFRGKYNIIQIGLFSGKYDIEE